MKELVSKLFNSAAAEHIHICAHVESMAHYHVNPSVYPRDKFTHEDWSYILDRTEAPADTTCIVCCHKCQTQLPSRIAESERRTKKYKEDEQRELKMKQDWLQKAITDNLFLYICNQCGNFIDEGDLIPVRFCPHCTIPFSGEEGRNCPDCNRPFSRLLTDKGCPDCADSYDEDDECELADLKQELRRLDNGNEER